MDKHEHVRSGLSLTAASAVSTSGHATGSDTSNDRKGSDPADLCKLLITPDHS